MSFVARYVGWCTECEGAIAIGDLVRYRRDQLANGDLVVHDQCPEPVPVAQPHEMVCSTCWLIHPPGVCDR